MSRTKRAAPSERERIRDRLLLYVRTLRVPPEEGLRLVLDSMGEADDFDGAMRALEKNLERTGCAAGFFDGTGDERTSISVPPYNRGSMPAAAFYPKSSGHPLNPFCRPGRLALCRHAEEPSPPKWAEAAHWRRWLFLLLIILPSIAATFFMADLLPNEGRTAVEATLSILFGVLFAWISTGFWTALFGFFVLLFKKNGGSIVTDTDGPLPKIPEDVRTAILVPVCNEEPTRVEAGVRATWSSLCQTGQARSFDFFILSDTSDPDVWVREEEMWLRLKDEFYGEDGASRIFYRRRTSNVKRKSGNVSNFCRRWGKNYKYMVVFDADSVMSGETLVRIVGAMERNPRVGILQTPPRGVNCDTLIARVQQFASALYGPIFAAGQNFWQLGEAQYWGHNAIIRLEPFMRFCELPKLPGHAPLGGEIMSHDFVESALMRRAGYEVWLAPNLGGSYEENPPTLIDELKRDRRWCQGNLQHMRLIGARGFFPTHRALFLNGILSYGSALLWFVFLVASSAQAVSDAFSIPTYFPDRNMLFPKWHVWYPEWSIMLLGYTAAILFLPKILALVYELFVRRGAKRFGGVAHLLRSVVGECIFSALMAPVRMMYHSYFVVATLLGGRIGWGAQSRGEGGTTWREATRAHWWATLAALLWGAFLCVATPSFFAWMLPVLLPVALTIPLSVLSGRTSLGRRARHAGLFLIPEELNVPPELSSLRAETPTSGGYRPLTLPDALGFVRAVLDPWLNTLHIKINARSKSQVGEDIMARALSEPETLTSAEKIKILSSPKTLRKLHEKVWSLSSAEASRRWGLE